MFTDSVFNLSFLSVCPLWALYAMLKALTVKSVNIIFDFLSFSFLLSIFKRFQIWITIICLKEIFNFFEFKKCNILIIDEKLEKFNIKRKRDINIYS